MSRGRDEVHEFRVGRIKHERVKVPRGEKLLEWAIQVMFFFTKSLSSIDREFVKRLKNINFKL